MARSGASIAGYALMQITRHGRLFAAHFRAMGSPCEVLAEEANTEEFARLASLVVREVTRIERKFTRFDEQGVPALLRQHAGQQVCLDAETAFLIDIAADWHARSDGLFDITCGALQRLWRFGYADAPPTVEAIKSALEHVGFQRLRWDRQALTVPCGMEIDLGGIAKEYAVDRAHDMLAAQLDAPALINLGGDLRVTRPPRLGHWRVGIECATGARTGGQVVTLVEGALATSGDAYRYIECDGRRYGHVLDPRTGWPAPDAPGSVSVAASTCIESGMLAKLALLHGKGAADYLASVNVRSWITSRPQVH